MTFKPVGALVGAMLLSFAVSGQAATIIGGSNLFTATGAAQVETWLNSASGLTYSGPLAFINVFDSAGGKGSVHFHAAADGIGPTIVLYEVTPINSTGSVIIGGFNPHSWGSSGFNTVTLPFSERTAFIFNLTNSDIRYQERASANGQTQTYNETFFGPTFGAGYDIYSDQFLAAGYVYAYSYCADPSTQCLLGLDLLGGAGTNFTISEIEVFTISADIPQTPVPPALPLFATGLGALGLVGWRRKKKAAALAA